MNQIKALFPCLSLPPMGPAVATQPFDPYGPACPREEVPLIPAKLVISERPVQVGSVQLPLDISHAQVAAWLKPIGSIYEGDDPRLGALVLGDARYWWSASSQPGGDTSRSDTLILAQVDRGGHRKHLMAHSLKTLRKVGELNFQSTAAFTPPILELPPEIIQKIIGEVGALDGPDLVTRLSFVEDPLGVAAVVEVSDRKFF